MSGSSKTEVVQEEKKFGEIGDYQNYNPETENATNFFKSSIGASPTSTFEEFMSQQAPGVMDFMAGAQGPMQESLTARANQLSSDAMSNVASQFGGMNAAYSRGGNNAIAEAGATPFADVANQLGMQQLNLGSGLINQGISSAYGDNAQRMSSYAGLSSPQMYNPYTYQGEQTASSGSGNFLTGLLGGAGVGAEVGGIPGAFLGGAAGSLAGLF